MVGLLPQGALACTPRLMFGVDHYDVKRDRWVTSWSAAFATETA
jgi:hypothetical protein